MAKSQHTEGAFSPHLYVATDLLKLSSNLLHKDYKSNAEAEVRFMFAPNIGLYAAAGHSERYARHVDQYKNLDNYSSKGSYFNAGICFQNDNEKVRFSMSIGYIRSYYSEQGEFVISGNYWSNDRLSHPMAYNNMVAEAIAIEPGFRFIPMPQYPKLSLYTGFGLNITRQGFTNPYQGSEIYDYKPMYIPGIMDRMGFGPFRMKINLCYRL